MAEDPVEAKNDTEDVTESEAPRNEEDANSAASNNDDDAKEEADESDEDAEADAVSMEDDTADAMEEAMETESRESKGFSTSLAKEPTRTWSRDHVEFRVSNVDSMMRKGIQTSEEYLEFFIFS